MSARVRLLARVAGGLAVLAVVGLAVVISGVVPIKASAGHFAVTAWFLNFAKERSVATHALFASGAAHSSSEKKPSRTGADATTGAPAASWLVVKGAGHYESGCLPCHGGPGENRPRIPLAMTPAPPRLEERALDYSHDELFYIVKHGIKFTGMPAWPAQSRDDEVRAIAAFLLVLPRLDEHGYRELVFGDTQDHDAGQHAHDAHGGAHDANAGTGAAMVSLLPTTAGTVCARCHGTRGEGRGTPAFPKLAGQRAGYMRDALRAYRDGERHSGIMGPVAAALTEPQMDELARAYAHLPPMTSTTSMTPADVAASATSIERGRAIAQVGVPARLVPPCAQCHEGDRSDAYPLLAGQYAAYLELQLELFRNGARGGAPFAALMHLPAHGVTADEARDVSLYYAAGAPPSGQR